MRTITKYRRDGTRYPPGMQGVLEWCDDFEDLHLRRVRFEQLPDGSQVSTIWIGVDLAPSFAILPDFVHVPLIFETMAWDPDGNIIWQERWATEKEATVGHIKIVHAMQRESRTKKQES